MDLAGAAIYAQIWCANDLQIALNEEPMGTYRKCIYDWLIRRGRSNTDASVAVKYTRMCYLKETNVGKKGKWRPSQSNPDNECKRWVYYTAVAGLLGWTQRREKLGE